jgi:2,4-diaminopentanoate dehydrogenase
MIMDTLPLLLSSLTEQVRSVRICRTADMSRYGAILSKFGLGLTQPQFDAAVDAGTVIGHVGFEQTVSALAAGLGWTLDEIAVDPVRPSIFASERREGEHCRIEPGSVAAVLHAARGMLRNETVIELAINFGIFTDNDPVEPGDVCTIEGAEQVIEVAAKRGYESFLSTVAVAANVVTAIVDAEPGVLSMSDLPVRALACKGAW